MISQEQAMRELHLYAMEEMRNRGLEEAAQICEQRGAERAYAAAYIIRQLKRNPASQMTDWWAPAIDPNFIPIGA